MKQPSLPQPLPPGARLLVPVVAASGGSGRSTVAGLVADALAARGRTVLADTGSRLSSPWPAVVKTPGGGLASVPPYQPVTGRDVRNAASLPAGATSDWDLLTDHQEWHRPPLDLPQAAAAWSQLAALGQWQVMVADTSWAATHDIVAAQHGGVPGRAADWCALPYSVPVVCAAATHNGMRGLQQLVKAAAGAGIPVQRMVVALVATAEGRLPPVIRAGLTMLTPLVSAVVSVPYASRVRAQGLGEAFQVRSLRGAGTELADAVLTSATAVWGDPLPDAPTPAPLRVPPVPAHEPPVTVPRLQKAVVLP